jgi:hypothetical protein
LEYPSGSAPPPELAVNETEYDPEHDLWLTCQDIAATVPQLEIGVVAGGTVTNVIALVGESLTFGYGLSGLGRHSGASMLITQRPLL